MTPARRYIEQLLVTLPLGQRRVAEALIGVATAPTYRPVAGQLGLSLGTAHRHLGRIRRGQPAVYGELMGVRRAQLAEAIGRPSGGQSIGPRSGIEASRHVGNYYRF